MGASKRPKVPEKTAQEKAFGRRSEVALDKEIEEENRRKRLLLRNTLGTGTLLSGLSSGGGLGTFSGTSFAARSASGGARAGGSLLSPSGGGGGTSGGGVRAGRIGGIGAF